MTQLQTGAVQVQNYSQALLNQLQKAVAQSGLGTAETEALMHWVYTETETHSQNISQLRQTLMNGLREFDWITNDQVVADSVYAAFLQAMSGVRYAAVIRKPGNPAKVIAYLGR